MTADTEGMKKCILLRHGETCGNALRRYTGCKSDEDLSESGILAISSLSERVRALYGRYSLFSGPLQRCTHTSGLLFPESRITIIDELTEMDFGRFEGKTYDELKNDASYRKWIKSFGLIPPPEGETREDFIRRSLAGFYKALSLAGSSDLFIVCHGGNIMAIMSALTGDGYYDHGAGNLEGYVLEFKEDDEGISDLTYDSIVFRDSG